MLATADGEWVFPDGAEFLAALGDPDPDYDAVGFAVRNFGFIKFEIINSSAVEIELHPRNVMPAALAAVHKQIAESAFRLFRIKYFDGEWRSEITASAEQALSRLRELCAPVFEPSRQDRFASEPRDLKRLLRDEVSVMRLATQKWRASFGYFDESVISFAIKYHLLSRLVIIGVGPQQSDPVFRFIGEGHANWLDVEHHLSAIGQKLENLPDKDYGGWASEFYKNAAGTGQPLYDCVSATIQKPSEPYTTRYERLLLPWKTPSKETLVTVFSRRLDETPPRGSC